MNKIFEMNRRAKTPLKCDMCEETIYPGDRWVFRREKTRYGWVDSSLCEMCDVFGNSEHHPYASGPFAPDAP